MAARKVSKKAITTMTKRPKAKKPIAKKQVTLKQAKKKAGKHAALPSDARKKMASRADLGQPGDVAMERMDEPQRTIARAADAAIRKAAPGCESVVKWGNACYYVDGRAIAAIYATGKGVNLAMAGAALDDPEGLLDGTGRSMRHVKLADAATASSRAVAALLKQAVKVGLDRM